MFYFFKARGWFCVPVGNGLRGAVIPTVANMPLVWFGQIDSGDLLKGSRLDRRPDTGIADVSHVDAAVSGDHWKDFDGWPLRGRRGQRDV